MKKILLVLSVIISLANFARASVVLTGFGLGDFSLDGSTIISSGSQDANGYSFTANDQNSLFAGTFASENITGQSAYITLTALVSNVNPLSDFTIQLVDSSFNVSSYSGNWSSFTTGVRTSAVFGFTSADSGFDDSSVIGIQIVFGGNGSGSLTINLDSLTATSSVPEPSTYAALFGAASLGFAVWRKRRKLA